MYHKTSGFLAETFAVEEVYRNHWAFKQQKKSMGNWQHFFSKAQDKTEKQSGGVRFQSKTPIILSVGAKWKQQNSPSLIQSFHRFELADRQRKEDTLLPSRRREHPAPTSPPPCYIPAGVNMWRKFTLKHDIKYQQFP